MNSGMVSIVLLAASIALGWPKFLGMFKLEVNPAAAEFTLLSIATAVCLAAIALALQEFGPLLGGLICILAVGSGQALRREGSTAGPETVVSALCLALFLGRELPVF